MIYPDDGLLISAISWVFLRFPGFLVIRFDILLDFGILDIPDILNHRRSSLWTSVKPGLGRDAPFPVAGPSRPLKAPQGPSRALNPLIYIYYIQVLE